MKNDVAFICVGQAGGNIGLLFEEKGYNVMYINTSQEDLDILKNSTHKYHVSNGEGCAKDRDRAKQLLADDMDSLIAQIRDTITQKYVFIVFSSGGGTGSGISPLLLRLLLDEFHAETDEEYDEEYDIPQPEPEKYFAAVTILPADEDKAQAGINSYNCCQELLDIDDLGSIFILDNACGKNKMNINRIFVDSLDCALRIPSKYKHKEGNVDKAELKRAIFETHGIATVNVAGHAKDKDATAVIAQLVRSNVYAPLQKDKTVMYYVTATTGKVNMDALAQEFGEPLDVFSTYNDEKNIVLMTGLSFPYDRVKGYLEKAKATNEALETKMNSLYENNLTESIKVSRKPRQKRKTKTETVVKTVATPDGSSEQVTEEVVKVAAKPSARDILNRYKRK